MENNIVRRLVLLICVVVLLFTLNFTTDKYYIYVDGVLDSSATTVLTAPTGLVQWNLGSDVTAAFQGGFNLDEVAVFSKAISAEEVAVLWNLDRPLVDMGAMEKPGIYILDGRFHISSSTTGNRIEIDADEIAGYDSGGTKQFYLQASDGKAIAGAGAVTLDEDGIIIQGESLTDPLLVADVNSLKFDYDDSGTARNIGKVYGYYRSNGMDRGRVVVLAVRNAGDPWTDYCGISLIADDNVAGDDVRLHITSNGTINGEAVETFIMYHSGLSNWLDFTYGGDYVLEFGDAAGGDRFQLKDSNGVIVLEVDSDGDTRIATGLHVGSTGTVPTDNDISCDGDIKCADDLRVGKGLYVGNVAGAPTEDNIICDGDIRVGKGLYVGQTGAAPTDNDIKCDEDVMIGKGLYVGSVGGAPTENDIICEGTIKTAAGHEWDLDGYTAAVQTPTGYVKVTIGGQEYRLVAKLQS